MLTINMTAWCRYTEDYEMEITSEYLERLNRVIRKAYPNAVFEDITEKDVANAMEWDFNTYDKVGMELDNYHTLADEINDIVRGDIWDNLMSTDYVETTDSEYYINYEPENEEE